MKNIWLVNYYSYPPGTSSWRRHFDLGKRLIKKGYSFDIICGAFVHDRKIYLLNGNENFRVEFHEGLRYHILKGIKYIGNIKRVISMVEFMIKVFFYEKKIEKKPDIIYCSCPHPFNGLVSLYLSRKYKVPFVLEIRDLWPDTWVEMGAMTRKNLIYKIFEFIERLLYKKADAIIGLMPGLDVFEKKGATKDKLYWISNGVDLEEFDRNLQKEPVYLLDKDKFNFVYTGSIGIANALNIIVDAAYKLKDDSQVMFNIIGDGPLKIEYEEIVKEKNLSNITFFKPVKKNEVPAILKEADCLIVPSKKTNLYKYGISYNKLFEYMASKKIILLSCDTQYDYIEKNDCGFMIETENLDKMVSTLLKIKNMSVEERETKGKNARKMVEKEFNMDILANKLDNIFNKVL